MTKVVYIEFNGTEHVVDAENGKSVMQNAVDNMIPGIIGDCGGCCTCATCHGYVDKSWQAKLSPKSEDEIMMIDGVIAARDESRLTCQIIVQLELDGLVVRLPESQF